MKKYTSLARKGFTLVELMIVIAIIGILAAVLYPAMTGYFERSRDTNRAGAMNQISLALGTYFTDHEEYPNEGANKCLSEVTTLDAKYIKALPTDPKKNHGVNNCDTKGGYGYKKINANNESTWGAGFAAVAKMEIAANGNIKLTEYETATNFQGMNTAGWKTRKELASEAPGTTGFAIFNQ